MTGWDVLDKVVNTLPPVAGVILLITAVIVFIVGFSRRGLNFIKYGFGKMGLDETLEKRFDDLRVGIGDLKTELGGEIGGLRTELGGEIGGLRTGLGGEISGLKTELGMIKDNHFGHLKDFLTELTSILLDKGVINNQDKARLDNRLRGM
jgi:hypothetical protein